MSNAQSSIMILAFAIAAPALIVAFTTLVVWAMSRVRRGR